MSGRQVSYEQLAEQWKKQAMGAMEQNAILNVALENTEAELAEANARIAELEGDEGPLIDLDAMQEDEDANQD